MWEAVPLRPPQHRSLQWQRRGFQSVCWLHRLRASGLHSRQLLPIFRSSYRWQRVRCIPWGAVWEPRGCRSWGRPFQAGAYQRSRRALSLEKRNSSSVTDKGRIQSCLIILHAKLAIKRCWQHMRTTEARTVAGKWAEPALHSSANQGLCTYVPCVVRGMSPTLKNCEAVLCPELRVTHSSNSPKRGNVFPTLTSTVGMWKSGDRYSCNGCRKSSVVLNTLN